MPKIDIRNLTVAYPAKKGMEYVCLDSLNASFADKKTNVILGESGSGKSTLLKAVAGILPYEGEILFNGQDARSRAKGSIGIAFVDQEITLYPNRTIFDNLALPLRIGHFSADEIRQKVFETAKTLSILSTLSRLPRQISIGQQQRACLGKALIKNPSLLLLDEPFSNIDEKRRAQERELLRTIASEKGMTVLLATHLQEDVLALGDEIFLLEEGNISASLSRDQLRASTHPLIRAMFAGYVNEDNHG